MAPPCCTFVQMIDSFRNIKSLMLCVVCVCARVCVHVKNPTVFLQTLTSLTICIFFLTVEAAHIHTQTKMIRVELIFPLVPEHVINHVTDSRVYNEIYLSHCSPPLVYGYFTRRLQSWL